MERSRSQQPDWQSWLWKAIAIALLGALWETPARSQIVPDGTLGPESSTVSLPAPSVTQIDGGATRGDNLFHSFTEFSLPAGNEAFFNNAPQIQHIFTRVTGNSLSNIDGTIRAAGAANLFLINPNGIAFGENARLQIGGSFFASTAESVLFSEGEHFDTVAVQPLLTVNVPVGLQLGKNSGAIAVRNIGSAALPPEVAGSESLGLSVGPGRAIALVGNEISFSGGIARTASGRIEVGSVASGTVDLAVATGTLGYDRVETFAPVTLAGRSLLFDSAVFDNPTSAIRIAGGTIDIDSSQVVAVAGDRFPTGNVSLQASESLSAFSTEVAAGNIENPVESRIATIVLPDATGNGGDVTIGAPFVSLRDGALVQTVSLGFGAAGDLQAEADALEIRGFAPLPADSTLLDISSSRLSTEIFASGSGGDLEVSARSLVLADGGQILSIANLLAAGNGGNIRVDAEEVAISGVNAADPLATSGIASENVGTAIGGNIDLSVGRLTLRDGGAVRARSLISGPGGRVVAIAREAIEIMGVNPLDTSFSSTIGTATFGTADAGDLVVRAPQVRVLEGGTIASSVFPQLFAVSTSNPDALEVALGIELLQNLPSEIATGNGGTTTVEADFLEIDGASELVPEVPSAIGTITTGSGNAGKLFVSAREIRLSEGGALTSLVFLAPNGFDRLVSGAGTGMGGNITAIASESIVVEGVEPILGTPSLLGTGTTGPGRAGDVFVATPRFSVLNGGRTDASTAGSGDAGTVTVVADEILASGIEPLSSVSATISASAILFNETLQNTFLLPGVPTGDTGRLALNARTIDVTDGGSINVTHEGSGNAGTLEAIADTISLDRGGSIAASTVTGLGGNLTLTIGDSLQLRGGSAIAAEALAGVGNGGNLTIVADTIALLENSSIIANSVGGNGGNIEIATRGLFLSPESTISASSQFGLDGTIDILQPEVNPADGLLALDATVLQTEERLESQCGNATGSSFFNVGRGGLPPSPFEVQFLRPHIFEWAELPEGELSEVREISLGETRDRIVEAGGWTVDRDGNRILVVAEKVGGDRASLAAANPWFSHPSCVRSGIEQ